MGMRVARAVVVAVAVVLLLFVGLLLLPPAAGIRTYATASAAIALVAATMGRVAGLLAVLVACLTTVLVELAPVGEFHIEQPADVLALSLFAANGVTVAVIGSLVYGVRTRRPMSPAVADRQPPVRSASVLLATRRRAGDIPLSLEVEPLTEREAEVLGLLCAGMTNAQIGDSLSISTNTVKSHLKNIYGKLGVGSRTSAVSRALEVGMLPTVAWAPQLAAIRDDDQAA